MKKAGARSLYIVKREVNIAYAVPRNNEYRIINATMCFMRNGMFRFTHTTEQIDFWTYRNKRRKEENKRKAYKSMSEFRDSFIKSIEYMKVRKLIYLDESGKWAKEPESKRRRRYDR